ncbi:MAG TPA: GntR family transcriptional regulator, partial [Arthrobacter bacterium]|nr:GntR family transcriptional regulator [Arthrobacter sp.]
LYFGSFSKMIAPGLRVGWVLPPEWLYGHLVNASETSQLNPSVFSQQLIGAYLDNPAWQDKLAEYRGIYREKFNALVETLEEVMPPRHHLEPSHRRLLPLDQGPGRN